MDKLHNIKNFDDPKSHSPVLNYALHANAINQNSLPLNTDEYRKENTTTTY